MTDSIPLDALYDVTRITEVALSPDGEHVAFIASEASRDDEERHSSLFVVPADGSRSPHRLTRVSDAGAPKWSPDGSRLGFLASREQDIELTVNDSESEDDGDTDTEATEDESSDDEETGEDEPRSQLWLFDLELGGDARQVTDCKEGVREFDWGPDGERVVISARDPTDDEREYLDARREDDAPIETQRLQHKWDGHGWLDTVTTYLFVVDLDTREEHRLDDAYGSGAVEPATGLQPTWNPHGERIAFVSNRTDRPDDSKVMDVYTIRPDGTGLNRLTNGDVRAMDLEWSPDGKQLAFAAMDPTNWCIPVQVYLWDGNRYESLTADLDRTLTWGPIRWLEDETLLANIADEADTRLARVHTDETPTEYVFERLSADRTVQGFDLRNERVALVLTQPQHGIDIQTIGADDLTADCDDTDPLTRVTAVNDDLLAQYPMPNCERVSFESEGNEIDGIAYLPPEFDQDDPEPHPLIVSIHGGPVFYDAPEFNFEYAVWASRGYIVLCPNYRGGSSYGRAFAEELHGQWGTVEVTDIVAGIESLVDRGWVDSDRVFGRGVSYGGIAQGYLVTQTDVLTAAVPEHGIYDLRAEFGTSDSHIQQENEFGLPWENPDQFDASSAITDAGNIDTPLLVMAGGEDWRCPPTQSEQLYVSARKQGVEAKLVVYPTEHHNISDPDRAVHRLEQLTEWFEKHDPAVENATVNDIESE
jgi:dipeptidyl aminopeptidase/acylaminoacyl peptidase